MVPINVIDIHNPRWLQETCRLFGWAPHTGMDTTKKFRDKSIVVMVRCKPRPVQFGCVALSDAQGVRFIGFPRDVLNWFQPVVRHSYAIGIEEEHPRAEKCFEFKLKVANVFINVLDVRLMTLPIG